MDETFTVHYSGNTERHKETKDVGEGITAFAYQNQTSDVAMDSVLLEVKGVDGEYLYRQHIPFLCSPALIAEVMTYPHNDRVDVNVDHSNYIEGESVELEVEVVCR